MANVKIEGLEELLKALDQFPKNLQKKALRPALREGAKVIHKQAKRFVPVDEGDLKRSLKVRAAKRNRKGIVAVNVQTSSEANVFSGEQFYGAFVEFGTSKTPAQPFLRPALDTSATEAKEAVADKLAQQIPKIAKDSTR